MKEIVVILVLLALAEGKAFGQSARAGNKGIVDLELLGEPGEILDVNFKLSPIESFGCIPKEYYFWYEQCELEEKADGCKIVKDCPYECAAANGQKYPIGGSWEEGRNVCTCAPVNHVYFYVPPIPPGGIPYPPIADCQLNGCRNYITREVIGNGQKFNSIDGRVCTCVSGPDPELMDGYTLFHVECEISNEIGEVTVVEEGKYTEETANTDLIVAEADAEIAQAMAEQAAADPVIAEADAEIAEARVDASTNVSV